jgi:hypothetical protein
VLAIRRVDLTRAVPDHPNLTPTQWLAFCQERGLVAFTAERDQGPVGFAAAESDATAVHVVLLEGDADACRVLLDRLVRLAGERDLSGWVPVDRPDLRGLFEGLGFFCSAQAEPGGRPSWFYYWCRNEDV